MYKGILYCGCSGGIGEKSTLLTKIRKLGQRSYIIKKDYVKIAFRIGDSC